MIVHTMEWDVIESGRVDHYYECDFIDIAYYECALFMRENGKMIGKVNLCDVVEIYDNNCSL